MMGESRGWDPTRRMACRRSCKLWRRSCKRQGIVLQNPPQAGSSAFDPMQIVTPPLPSAGDDVALQVSENIEYLMQQQDQLRSKRDQLVRTLQAEQRAPRADWQRARFPWDQLQARRAWPWQGSLTSDRMQQNHACCLHCTLVGFCMRAHGHAPRPSLMPRLHRMRPVSHARRDDDHATHQACAHLADGRQH